MIFRTCHHFSSSISTPKLGSCALRQHQHTSCQDHEAVTPRELIRNSRVGWRDAARIQEVGRNRRAFRRPPLLILQMLTQSAKCRVVVVRFFWTCWVMMTVVVASIQSAVCFPSGICPTRDPPPPLPSAGYPKTLIPSRGGPCTSLRLPPASQLRTIFNCTPPPT